jgi:hypothetical protein
MPETPVDPLANTITPPGFPDLWAVAPVAGTEPETPIPAAALAQLANYRKLEDLARSGALNAYRGQYVAVLNEELVGHDSDGERLLKKIAEERGEAAVLVACRYLD